MSHRPARVVDAHHHLWDLERMRYPWLQDGPPVEEDTSGLAPIRRTYSVEDFRADADGIPLVGSVHVEAAHDPAHPERETVWLDSVAERGGLPTVLVAYAPLDAPDLEAILDSHARSPRLRGIRQMVNWEPGDEVAPRPGMLDEPRWLDGLGMLAGRGLSFDLQVFPSQLHRAAEVVAAHPELDFVLDHGGYLLPETAERTRLWRSGLRELAASPNVVAKGSGFASLDPGFGVDGLRAYLDALIDAFGPQRLLYGSNFPVDKRFVDYRTQFNACVEATASWSAEDREAFFFGNAARVYRMGDEQLLDRRPSE